jgi:hypothetical protein
MVSELFDLLLIANSVFEISVFAISILIKTLLMLLPLFKTIVDPTSGRAKSTVTNRAQVVVAPRIKHVLHVLQLNVTVEWHVGHHDSNVLWSNKTIIIKIIPIKIHFISKIFSNTNLIKTYMSKVNFIFASRSPMNTVVKFLMKDVLVTKSSIFAF